MKSWELKNAKALIAWPRDWSSLWKSLVEETVIVTSGCRGHTELRTYQVLAARLAQGLLDGEPRSLRCYWPSKTWFWNVLEGHAEGREQGSAPQQGEDPGWVKDGYLGDSVAWLSFLLLSHPPFQCFVSIGWRYNGRLHISYVWNLPKENGPTVKSHSVPCLSVLFFQSRNLCTWNQKPSIVQNPKPSSDDLRTTLD